MSAADSAAGSVAVVQLHLHAAREIGAPVRRVDETGETLVGNDAVFPHPVGEFAQDFFGLARPIDEAIGDDLDRVGRHSVGVAKLVLLRLADPVSPPPPAAARVPAVAFALNPGWT